MAFNTFATSDDNAVLVELYHFIVGTTEYRYASTEDAYIVSGQADTQLNGTYLGSAGEPIEASAPVHSRDLNQSQMTARIARDHPIAQLFYGAPPTQVSKLYIYRTHLGDADVKRFWAGDFVGCDLAGQKLTLEPKLSRMRRSSLRWRFQGPCNLIFGSPRCGVDLESLKATGTLDAIDGVVLTSTTFGLQADGYYDLGKLRLDSGELRYITKHVGDDVTVRMPFTNATVGDGFDVFPGCNHGSDCADRWDNKPNQMAWFTTPQKNLFITGIK